VPFQPVAGLFGSDVPAASGLQMVRDPYSGVEVYVVPAIRPDWAIIHVHEADALGNARIYGSVFWDRLMSRAARGVILTAERIVPTAELARQPELTVIPALLVRAVVEAPGGAAPCSCAPAYDTDRAGVEAYLAACGDPAALAAYLDAQDSELRGQPSRAMPAGGLGATGERQSVADDDPIAAGLAQIASGGRPDGLHQDVSGGNGRSTPPCADTPVEPPPVRQVP
jgi:hypothetical protein